jgi:NtrC-family two-component system sensor histidine kinase KinB
MFNSLRARLLLSHLLLVGLMLVALVGAVAGFFQLGRSVDRILKDNYKSVVAAQDMKETLERIDSAATFLLAGQATKARRQYEANRPRFEAARRTESSNVTEAGEQTLSDDIGRRYVAYRQGIEQMLYASPSLPTADARALYFGTLEPAFLALKRRAQDILDLNQAAIVRADARAKAEARRDALLGVAATAAAGILAILLALRLTGTIMTPLISLTRQAEQIGEGHLNQRIEVRRNDEIGQLAQTFNGMAESLRQARRREEERLRRAERMSDVALESLYDPVIVTDASGRVVHLNRAAEGLFGPEARSQGRPAREVVREGRLAGAIERAVRQEQVSAEEGEGALISFRDGGGAVEPARVYRLRANPMRGDDGTHLGAVAVLEDVTYQQEISRLKTEFIGVASHELRTPVTSLLLGVQLLQEGAVGKLTGEQQGIVDALRGDLDRLGRMMHDLLDLTRLEAGATPPRFEVVPPGELVEVARQAVATTATSKGVRLVSETADDLPAVRADRGQIGRVLINLLSNAIRHTPAGGTVRLAAAGEDDGVSVRLTVADTGAGIPPEYQGHIFERFVQVPGATRGGAGLGLSLAQSIVRAHGGEIRVVSAVGAGSVFWFALPAAGGGEG